MAFKVNLIYVPLLLITFQIQHIDSFSSRISVDRVVGKHKKTQNILFQSSNCQEFEEDKEQNNDAFVSPYTFIGTNDAQPSLFEDEKQANGYSKMMSDAYQTPSSNFRENIGVILSCSLLVTGNTVGAGMSLDV